MRDYAAVSYWLETCGDDLMPRPALDGSTDCDVAILGGGYTGLWTAYYLLREQPSMRVVLVERDICGFGASGRNGGWCAPGLNISLRRLEQLHGFDAARNTYAAVDEAVDETGRVAQAEGLDIEWRRGGELIIARGAHETPQVEAAFGELERFGFGERYALLDAAALRRRVRVAEATGALYSPHAAVLQPARLARGRKSVTSVPS